MKFLLSTFYFLLFVLLICAGCDRTVAPAPVTRPKPSVTFKPKEMADALHAVIAADREAYARDVVQRLADAKILRASENWRDDHSLPPPAHLLRIASEAVQQKGAEFHYVIRALQPLNPRNAPETAIEKAGLEFVMSNSETNYYSEESLGGRLYFTAVYPDKAVVPVCVDCHKQHPANTRKDLKLGDVMGGMIVRVPLEF